MPNVRFILDHRGKVARQEPLDAIRTLPAKGGHGRHNELRRVEAVHVGVTPGHLDAYAEVRVPSLHGRCRLHRQRLIVDKEDDRLGEAVVRPQVRGDGRLAESGSKDGQLPIDAPVVGFLGPG